MKLPSKHIFVLMMLSLFTSLPAFSAEPAKLPAQLKPVQVVKPQIKTQSAPIPLPEADFSLPRGASSGIGLQEIRAQVMAKRYTTLSAELGAVVNKIHKPDGSRFTEGEVLISLDCEVQKAQREKAQAEFTAAKQTYSANQKLAELDAMGAVEVDVAKGNFERAEAEVKTLEAQIAKCEIKAPFTGVVTDQRVRERQYVQPGQTMLEVVDDSAFEVEFLAPSTWMSRLKEGSRLAVRVDELGRAFPATVSRLSHKVDPASQSIKVTAQIDYKGDALRSGMSGRVSFKR